jgi:hypothetical protein
MWNGLPVVGGVVDGLQLGWACGGPAMYPLTRDPAGALSF